MIRKSAFLIAVIFASSPWLFGRAECAFEASSSTGQAEPIRYCVILDDAARHLVHVRMYIAKTDPDASQTLTMPVWNALYQIRDFSQYVQSVTVHDLITGQDYRAPQITKDTWALGGGAPALLVEYAVSANQPGPFGAEFNSEHAFFNLAEILMFIQERRNAKVRIGFAGVKPGWTMATALEGEPGSPDFTAASYDDLVDSPVEIGKLAETSFEQSGATYRIAVDADPADYSMKGIEDTVRRIVSVETAWMNDRPFQQYLFIYHFPKGPAGGGMEHAYSTAIAVNAGRLAADPLAFASVTAHEFFHLWNVKRIRPRSLEPVDYTRENYCDALWFSEGVTSTVSEHMLYKSGLQDEKQFLDRLASEIRELQSRPARLTQSAEQSSIEAWLEKYPHYRLPTRSISYYNKGQILGELLDLEIRNKTQGAKSLRDLFRWMNEASARNPKTIGEKRQWTFSDTSGLSEDARGFGVDDQFFRAYVGGTEEIPYNDFFRTVGLELKTRTIITADPGFSSVRNFDALPVVVSVTSGSAAQKAGLAPGDSILELDGHPVSADLDYAFEGRRPGEVVRLRISGSRGTRAIKIKLGSRRETDYYFADLAPLTPAQRARRNAWLIGEDEPAPR